jgi:hypothetical protein
VVVDSDVELVERDVDALSDVDDILVDELELMELVLSDRLVDEVDKLVEVL